MTVDWLKIFHFFVKGMQKFLNIYSFSDGFVYAVDFEPCFPAVKNEPCNMTCRIPDFAQVIEFTCGATVRGRCTILSCNNMVKEGGNTLYLPISSVAYSDNCEWGCTYGTTPASSATVTVFSKYDNRIKKTILYLKNLL